MAPTVEQKPVGDDVPVADGAIAVGEDLAFQRKWWRFETVVWSFFALILLADLSGVLGRGPLANAERQTPDNLLKLKYERVQRENTASILSVIPAASALHDGKLRLYVSDSIVKQLGAQRIIPQPVTSTVGEGGVTYTFPTTAPPVLVQFELKPSFIGRHHFRVGLAGSQPVEADALVLP